MIGLCRSLQAMLTLLLSMWIIAGPAYAKNEAISSALLSEESPHITLTNSLRQYESPTNIEPIKNLPLDKIIREATLRHNHILSNPESDYWFYGQFRTGNTLASSEGVLVLDHPYPLYEKVTLILNPQAKNPIIIENDNTHSIKNHTIKTRLIAFRLKVEPNQSYDFLIKVHSLAKQPFSLSVQTLDHFVSDSTYTEFLWGIFFGLFIIAAMYNLLIYSATQQTVYLYYVFFIISVGLSQAGLTSHGISFLWPDSDLWNKSSYLFFIGLAGIFGILFTQSFLNTKSCAPNIHKYLTATHIPCALVVLLSQALRYDIAIAITDLTISWLFVLMISAGVVSYKSGEKTARFFLIGWGSLLSCASIYIFAMRGFIPINTFTLFSPQIGSFLEIIIITMAIADRIRQDRSDKSEAIKLQQATILKLEKAENALTQQLLRDPATGLANQYMLAKAINQALQAKRTEEVYLVLVKIKDLREINNTLGRYIGDKVAEYTANHLKEIVGNLPTQFQCDFCSQEENLAVIQGITFAFLIKAPNDESAVNLVTNALEGIPKRFHLDSISLEIETYAGISSSSQAQSNSDIWMRNAFVAIEQAAKHTNNCQVYDEAFNPYNERRLALINDLKSAVENDELMVYLQPQLDAKTNTIVSAEALLRWIHPEHGFVPPDEFIPLAEDSGVIKSLTRWVLLNAIKALHRLHQQGYIICMSINISPKNLEEEDLTAFIVDTLRRFDIDNRYLTFEITETAMLENPDLAFNVLNGWKNMGIVTAIDDFGTGYSSLSHLKRLPMKELKIDRSFIKDLMQNEDDKHIVSATLTIGHSLGMRVVAEGVEDETVLTQLKDMECDLIQGYHLTAPLPLNKFVEWLENSAYAIGHPKLRPISGKQKNG